MMTKLQVTTSIDEDIQEENNMNSTLQGFGEERAISIAVHLPDGIDKGVDPDDQEAVSGLLSRIFASALAAGCTVEAQIGRSRSAMEADDTKGEDGN